MPYEIGELEAIIRPDGEMFIVGNGADRAVAPISGRGAAAVEYTTVRGYLQQSETVLGWRLLPRSLSLVLNWDVQTREDYWQARQDLQRFLRPNLGGDLILRHTRQNGVLRDIKARVDSSPEFADDMNWESMAETLSFIAFDPTFYDPTNQVLTFTKAAPVHLTFPVTFPISFDDPDLVGDDQTVTYTGEFPTWPTIDITGPYSWVAVQNLTTGKMIKLGQPVSAGQTRHIVLIPGNRQIVDGSGNDCFSELILPDSDLLGFNLRPDGVPVPDDPHEGVSGGVNIVRVTAGDAQVGVTQVTLTYQTRYLSVA